MLQFIGIMVALEPIKILKEKKQKLLEEQEKLIQLIKDKYSDAHEWMEANGVNLLDLKVHAAGLAAAMVIATNVAYADAMPTSIPQLVQQVDIIETQELFGMSHEEKAYLVWERYGHIIKRAAEKYELDSKVIFATIMLESGGNTYAIRHEPQINDASYGLGQMLFGTARLIGFEGTPNQLYDPEVNIELIARYHKRNLEVYGDLTPQELTTAYNAGSPYSSPHPGHIEKFNNFYELVDSYI